MSALALELGVLALMLLIFFGGLFGRRDDTRRVGVISVLGLVVLLGWALRMEPGATWLGEGFVQDELALFAKRLFLVATALGVLGSLTLRAPVFARRATEYYLLMLASLLGMLVLASARDLILLFVAFELMSIPLYVLAGFQKGEEMAVEAALKFFLVGTVSSALIAYGLSFVYGIARTTALPGVASALSAGSPLMILGLVVTLAGLGFKIAAVPFHMWVPDTYEAANAPFVAWLSVAPKAAGFIVIFRLYLEGVGDRAVLWVPIATGLAALTIVAGNLMAIPQQNVKRLLAYSGIAHIGYMLIGFAAVSANGVAMMLFYLVAYLFGNMGAFLVVEAVTQSEGSERIDAYKGLAQRSPLLALALVRAERHLQRLEEPRSQRALELIERGGRVMGDADPADPAFLALGLEPRQMLLPGNEVVYLLDIDPSEPGELVGVLATCLRLRSAPDLRQDGRLAAPPVESEAERTLGGAVHRRGVEAAAARVERDSDDVARKALVALEGVPRAEPDDRSEAPLLHVQPASRRATTPAAKAARKNAGSSSGPRPMCSSGRPAQASSQPSPSASEATATSPRQRSSTVCAWCETLRWRSRASASEVRTASTGRPPSAIAVLAASARASAP